MRDERKLLLTYRNDADVETTRIVRPIAVVYHVETVMLAAWCELRDGFRHFRADRIYGCEMLEDCFTGQSAALRAIWQEKNNWEHS